ncbi:hypothetical protein QJV45_14035 [Listeria booriae]|uniref:hypothetical protein n=1 Tax=Listeria booriae TaxID=1552123 RepID=UPI002880A368|nr:hypothetical protein [Listeria booriae]MDT0111598.1 hypothetical protein [Listeria booriae]
MYNIEKVMYEKIRFFNDVLIYDILHNKNPEDIYDEFKQFHKNAVWLLESAASEERFGELTRVKTAGTQFLLYALWMVDFNIDAYHKYFNNIKAMSYWLRRNILFDSGFDNPDSWQCIEIDDAKSNPSLAKTFVDPIAYCNHTLTENEYAAEAIREHGVKNLELEELFEIYLKSLNE